MSTVKKNYADMDPLEEIQTIKREISRRFPTVKAYCDYLRAKYPDTAPSRQPQPNSQRASAKPKTRANARPAMHQRKAAAPV